LENPHGVVNIRTKWVGSGKNSPRPCCTDSKCDDLEYCVVERFSGGAYVVQGALRAKFRVENICVEEIFQRRKKTDCQL
jgi:hypothetical protein